MMTETETNTSSRIVRKLIIPMLAGAVSGFLMVLAIFAFIDSEWAGALSRAEEQALIVGAFYVLIGIGVGLGALRPEIGSKLLNVEDAEELREQRAILIYSSLSVVFWGIALMVLSLAGTGALIAPVPALVVVLASMGIGVYVTWRSSKLSDELMSAINSEGTVIAYILTFAVLGGWAIAAQLGFAAMMEPLDLVTLFYVIALLSTFIAAGRRGMLKLRG